MYVGRHVRQLDGKGRVAVPAEFLARMGPEDRGEVYVTPGENGCIWLVPKTFYEAMAASLDESEGADEIRDQFYHLSQLRPIDKAGRIVLDEDARAFAGVPDPSGDGKVAVVVCGSGRYMQVWEHRDYETRAKAPRDFAKNLRVLRKRAEASLR